MDKGDASTERGAKDNAPAKAIRMVHISELAGTFDDAGLPWRGIGTRSTLPIPWRGLIALRIRS
jgi:hypothetical protein